ncbi:MAG: molybdenum cofactor guanylyltransferase [Planctomycetes bacterium]|nr:molybdenum cofactor guanylyltransferase [Planctomycetota bacterium]
MIKNPAIAILAGGNSERMGMDKSQLEIAGRSILGRLVDVATALTDTVLVVGRTKLNESVATNVHCVKDHWKDSGPLGGIATALKETGGDVLVVACDMPSIKIEALEFLRDQHQNTAPEQMGTVVNWNAQIQPLFAYYRAKVLAPMEKALEKKELAVHRFIKGNRFKVLEMPDLLSESLFNINTPDEWSRYKSRRKLSAVY